MVVRTIWNYGGLRGAWQTVGAVGVHRGLKRARDSCRGSNEAAGAMSINIVIYDTGSFTAVER